MNGGSTRKQKAPSMGLLARGHALSPVYRAFCLRVDPPFMAGRPAPPPDGGGSPEFRLASALGRCPCRFIHFLQLLGARDPLGRARIEPYERPMSTKYVYFFGGGKAEGRADMKDLLGGKGANLAEMTNIGLPVPAGFTLTTEVCTYYDAHNRTYPPELKAQVEAALKQDRGGRWGPSSATPRTRCSSRAAPGPASACRA